MIATICACRGPLTIGPNAHRQEVTVVIAFNKFTLYCIRASFTLFHPSLIYIIGRCLKSKWSPSFFLKELPLQTQELRRQGNLQCKIKTNFTVVKGNFTMVKGNFSVIKTNFTMVHGNFTMVKGNLTCCDKKTLQ